MIYVAHPKTHLISNYGANFTFLKKFFMQKSSVTSSRSHASKWQNDQIDYLPSSVESFQKSLFFMCTTILPAFRFQHWDCFPPPPFTKSHSFFSFQNRSPTREKGSRPHHKLCQILLVDLHSSPPSQYFHTYSYVINCNNWFVASCSCQICQSFILGGIATVSHSF